MDENGNFAFRVDRFEGLGLGFAGSRPDSLMVIRKVEFGQKPVNAQGSTGAGAPNDEFRLLGHNSAFSSEGVVRIGNNERVPK